MKKVLKIIGIIFAILAILVVLIAIFGEDKDAEKDEQVSSNQQETMYNDEEKKNEIKNEVESVINSEYMKNDYFCNILTGNEGYIVSLQLSADLSIEQGTEMAKQEVEKIKAIGDPTISEIRIDVYDSKLQPAGQYWWPLDE